MASTDSAFTTSFDLSFDHTFQELIAMIGPVTVDPCALSGTHLMWLSNLGWGYHLFRAKAETDYLASSVGQFSQGGLDRDTQRIGQQQKTVRAGGLTQLESQVLAGITTSPTVVVLQPDAAGQLQGVIVRVEPGSFAVWRENSSRIGLELKLLFPSRKFQRA